MNNFYNNFVKGNQFHEVMAQ